MRHCLNPELISLVIKQNQQLMLVRAITFLVVFQCVASQWSNPREREYRVPSVGNFKSGFFWFNSKNTSRQSTFDSVTRPVLLLSICQLEYQTSPIKLRLYRSLERLSQKRMIITVNASVSNVFPERQLLYDITVMYLVTQQTVNMEAQTVNLTFSPYQTQIRYSNPPNNQTIVAYFLLGFSDYTLTQGIRIWDHKITKNNYIYINNERLLYNVKDWMEIVIVIIDFKRDCSEGEYTHLRSLRLFDDRQHITLVLPNYREELFYLVGINFIILDKVSFNVNFTKDQPYITSQFESWLSYSALGMNLSCVFSWNGEGELRRNKPKTSFENLNFKPNSTSKITPIPISQELINRQIDDRDVAIIPNPQPASSPLPSNKTSASQTNVTANLPVNNTITLTPIKVASRVAAFNIRLLGESSIIMTLMIVLIALNKF